MAARQVLIETGQVDSTRIGVIGSRYGGSLALAALAFYPDTFQVGVDLFGVANWPRALKNIPPWWESRRAALYADLGNPATDGERLAGISPALHASRVVSPLLVVQGLNDERVPKAESEAMVAAVRRNGTPVDYVVLPDEAHTLSKKESERLVYTQVLAFLDKYLKTRYKRPAR